MLTVNTDYITGKKLELLGLVKGSTVQSKNIGKDMGTVNVSGTVRATGDINVIASAGKEEIVKDESLWSWAKGGSSTDKKFKKSVKTVTVKKPKTTSVAIKKLTGKKTYYVRIRTYQTVRQKTYPSPWSKAKSAVVK